MLLLWWCARRAALLSSVPAQAGAKKRGLCCVAVAAPVHSSAAQTSTSMADDGAAAVIAGGGTYEPIGAELPQFCNRLENALNDKSRLRLVKAADFAFTCAEAESVVAKVHEQDGKVEALLYLYAKLTDLSGFDDLLGRALQWKEDQEAVKTRVAALGADAEVGGKTVGGGAVGASLSAPSEFERAVPRGYNAPTAVRDVSATVGGHNSAASGDAAESLTAAEAPSADEPVGGAAEVASEPEPEPESQPEPEPEPEPEPKPIPEAVTPPRAQAPAGYFSLSELQSGCPPGVDASHKELSLDPAEFESAIGTSPGEFAKLPNWKQSAAKKKAGIF